MLDGRGLSGSDQENIKLHRTIADLDKKVKQQENALAQLTLIQRGTPPLTLPTKLLY